MGKLEKLNAKLERKEISPMSYHRQVKGMTLEQLAESITPQVTSATIRKWECKNVKFPRKISRQIAKVLDINPEVLL